MAQMINNLPAVRETWVQSLGQKDPLEEEMATHSSILAGESHGRRSLAGYSPRGHKESDTTERLTLSRSHWDPSTCMRSPIFVKPWTPTLTPKLHWCVDRGQYLNLWCMAGKSATTWEGKATPDVRLCSVSLQKSSLKLQPPKSCQLSSISLHVLPFTNTILSHGHAVVAL